MRKFIAVKNDVFYSIEQEGDVVKFYAHKRYSHYNQRKDVTPKVLPNKTVINEIIERPTIGTVMSSELARFIDELEKLFKAVEAEKK